MVQPPALSSPLQGVSPELAEAEEKGADKAGTGWRHVLHVVVFGLSLAMAMAGNKTGEADGGGRFGSQGDVVCCEVPSMFTNVGKSTGEKGGPSSLAWLMGAI